MPLTAALAASLRGGLQEARARLDESREHEVGTLMASEEWRGLGETERHTILRANALGPVPTLDVGTDDALLAALDAAPLTDWEDKIAALPQRVARARAEMTRLRSPQAVPVRPRPATLKTPDDVDTYLAALRAEIMAHVDAGKPVII